MPLSLVETIAVSTGFLRQIEGTVGILEDLVAAQGAVIERNTY